MSSAVQVVVPDSESGNSYKLNLKELEKILGGKTIINKKVVLISIAGAFRKVKSFMLNFFVYYLEWLQKGGQGNWFHANTSLDKFHWRSGTQKDTNGIFLWSVPYILKDKNGEEVSYCHCLSRKLIFKKLNLNLKNSWEFLFPYYSAKNN